MINTHSVILFVVLSFFLAACQNEGESQTDGSVMHLQPTTKTINEIAIETRMSRIKNITAQPPVAERIDHSVTHHGKELKDPYSWIRDPGYPKVDDAAVLNYLKAENAYYHKFLDPHADLVERVFQEFKGRTDETEESVPYTLNGYQYQWFYREGQEYRTRSRKNLESGAEQVFLDESALAEGHDYYDLGDWEISPDNRYLAYSFNTAGDERYKVRIQDLETMFNGDIQSINDTFNNMDFSIYNDSALITNLEEETNQRFDSIQNQLNEFTGNTTTFNLNDIIQTQTQLYVAKETQKQIKSIFEDEEENKDEINLSNYVTFSDLNSRLNSIQSTSTENTNAANKNMMYFGFLLIIGGAVAFYYKIFQPMQRKLNNLQRNNSVSLPQEPILPTQQNKEGEKNDNPFSNKN